jgi:transposase
VLWKLHAQHVWFATEPTRIRSPQDNPGVERAVQDVRGNFGAGEYFTDLADPQNRVEI